MSDYWPDTDTKLSPEARADLKQLSKDHAINAELIHSLTASKEEARAHLAFYKRMMIFSNGLLMFLGIALAGFGITKLIDSFSILGLFCLTAGTLLFLKFTTVFISMNRGLQETEAVARKHQLI